MPPRVSRLERELNTRRFGPIERFLKNLARRNLVLLRVIPPKQNDKQLWNPLQLFR